ncbi:subtilisin-like protease SBT1.5, partial [Magnolia sinica]|uniref:subtilisin-like protease SBT1.5 n=1 Tax=Magnolia sinica TaxID=86752 RepID=UPI00265A697C
SSPFVSFSCTRQQHSSFYSVHHQPFPPFVFFPKIANKPNQNPSPNPQSPPFKYLHSTICSNAFNSSFITENTIFLQKPTSLSISTPQSFQMTLLWALFLTSWLAFSAIATLDPAQRSTFIVRIRNDLKPSVFRDVDQWYKSTLKSLTSNPYESQDSSEGDFLHVYRTVFHGFSAKLSSAEASEIKNRLGVLDVFPDRVRQIQTTRSPQFLGLTANSRHGLLAESNYGSNVVIGVLDTGIWPERRSFNDGDLGPVPPHWKGECVEGDRFSKSNCNRKVVGARFFFAGYEAARGKINGSAEIKSARDSDGHGTHTASTAAGGHVSGGSMLGYANGVASGIAPKARIAAYKICWSSGCLDSDILAAIDQAVADGVNVISLSVGSGAVPYYYDPIAMGTFGAVERGIFVSASAGNEGPGEMTVTNVAPWITTVGAGTIDRNFPADILLGNGKVITGVSLYSGSDFPPKRFFPIVYAWNATGGAGTSSLGPLCMKGTLDPQVVRGKIVLCDRGGIPRAVKGEVVKEAGGAGMILANSAYDGEGLVADAHVLPAVAIGEKEGYDVHGYLATTKDARATFVFRGTQLGVHPAPVVASFSSRGPDLESPYIIKPDVVAPGVNILAAWPDGVGPTNLPSDKRRTEFNILSGTSMACPHVSGLAALLKGANPDWSPATIRSALMTTAYVQDNVGHTLLDEKSGNASTVWDLGSGHVDPEKAIDPGLVYDLTVEDYLHFLCDSNYTRRNIRSITRRQVNCTTPRGQPWNINYPSISVVFEGSTAGMKQVEVRRTVTNVGDGASVYNVKVRNPVGATVTVDPTRLEFGGKGEKRSYVVRITAASVNLMPGSSKSEFGVLAWADGRHVASSPVVVTWQLKY